MSLSPDEYVELDHFREELLDLKRRVDALEHCPPPAPVSPFGMTQYLPNGRAPAATPDFALPTAHHTIPVAGRALLGLAGAFLLRALADSGAVPRPVAVAAALVFAAAWLVFSRRVREHNAFASATYGITAALILMPLLWEATVRFPILPPPITAIILVAFFALSSILSWSARSEVLTVVVSFTTLLTTLVLMVETGKLASFVSALLAVAAIIEVLVCTGHARKLRIAGALAADIGIWLMFYVMTQPGGPPASYTPIPLPLSLTLAGLFSAIYSASLLSQIAALRPVTWFTMAQWAIALGSSLAGALQLTQGRSAALLAALCAVASAGSYFAAFLWFRDKPPRAGILFAITSVAFALLACLLELPAQGLAMIWGVAAAISTVLGARHAQPRLLLQGGAYLIAAGASSSIPFTILRAFSQDQPDPPPLALWIAAICGAVCYVSATRAQFARIGVIFRFLAALFTALVSSALLILTTLPIVSRQPTPAIWATTRSMVICLLVLLLGVAGSRLHRPELVRLSYLAMALGALKLILEDFRYSHAAALAVCLLCYGGLFILIPRLNLQNSSSRPESENEPGPPPQNE